MVLREFVHFVWDLSPPKIRVVAWRNFARTRVPTMRRTCVGFYVYRGHPYENNDIFLQKCVHAGLDFCCGDLRQWVGRRDRRQ